jgi:protein-L-isoaspartate(D-aspartate) O-methyltransferase
MASRSLEAVRCAYAEKIAAQADLQSVALARAFAEVAREDFVGPGPWQLMRPVDLDPSYEQTPDADPVHLYDTVLVALDPARRLNNGEPASLARWLDALSLTPGDHFLHVGCGVGYYTAIAAHAIGSTGRVLGLEVVPELAERAQQNLDAWAHAEVRCGSEIASAEEPFDAIFVNAGATEIRCEWLDALSRCGRLLVPLTVGLREQEVGVGRMLLVEKCERELAARFVTPVAIFHCAGARSVRGEQRLRRAFDAGGAESIRSLRRDPHASGADCWLHAGSFCLSSA